MLLTRHPSHCALLRLFGIGQLFALFGLGRLLAFSGDIKKQWELHTVDGVILVTPKNGIGARLINEELAGGKNEVAHQKCLLP